jgi:hypothetical protein
VLVRRGPADQPFTGNSDQFHDVPVIHTLHELLPLI